MPFILKRFTSGELKDKQTRRLQYALATIGDAGAPAMIGALTSENPAVIIEATGALRYFDSETALPWLMRPYFYTGSSQFDAQSSLIIQQHAKAAISRNLSGLPTRDEAATMLRRRVERLINDPLALASDLDGNTPVSVSYTHLTLPTILRV